MRYGYAWRVSDGFRAYYEVLNPGTTEDVELGTFGTETEARRAVETALLTTPAFTKSVWNLSGLGDVTRVGKVGKAPPSPPSGFGKEQTREDYRRRIDWEAWAATKAREDGHEAVAQGHDMARANYVTNYGLKVNGGLRGFDGVPALDKFTQGYVEAALWSSTGDDDEPLDSAYDLSDIADETRKKILKDTKKFQEGNAKDLAQFDSSRAGHDFWLTRNGHGAGFWDGDYPEPQAARLTEASKAFGETDLYVGDDGKLYLSR
jgi:hypothetical protein